jgi:hypothetical protein
VVTRPRQQTLRAVVQQLLKLAATGFHESFNPIILDSRLMH